MNFLPGVKANKWYIYGTTGHIVVLVQKVRIILKNLYNQNGALLLFDIYRLENASMKNMCSVGKNV